MKVCLITFITPASENIRGTSALPYYLIKGGLFNLNKNAYGNDGNHLTIYSYNANKLSEEKITEVEKELSTTIKVIPLPKWYLWMFKFRLLFIRVLLKYPFVNYISLPHKIVEAIKNQDPDLIWVKIWYLFFSIIIMPTVWGICMRHCIITIEIRIPFLLPGLLRNY